LTEIFYLPKPAASSDYNLRNCTVEVYGPRSFDHQVESDEARITRIWELLYLSALKAVKNSDDAHDIAMEAFVAFLQARIPLIRNGDAFARQILKNKLVDFFRARTTRARHIPRSTDEPTFIEPAKPPAPGHEQAIATAEMLNYLKGSLEDHRDLQDTLAALLAVEGHAVNKDVGATLGIKPETARRLIAKLKLALNKRTLKEKLRQMLTVTAMRKKV
jgi:DNA-directed RNA polymerase specialized sigma24 family protein